MSESGLDLRARLRVGIARRLEEGVWEGGVGRALASVWGLAAARSLERPLRWPGAGGPDSPALVAVGGATLGGSGKTPLAIACAHAIARTGVRVALVGHGYGARADAPRLVRPDDEVGAVGDEAIVAARALDGAASVVVGASRQAAVDRAASLADVIVLDGPLQTAPRRASLSLLALDGASLWGSGAVVPWGDLRAPREALIAASDRVVVLRDETDDSTDRLVTARPAHVATVRSRGALAMACPGGEPVRWSSLRALRVGLFVALARPGRVLAALARRGVVPRRVLRVPDHGASHLDSPRLHSIVAAADREVDVWIATPKCALHLEKCGVPHLVVDHDVALPADLVHVLERLAERPHLHLRGGFSVESLAP